jgi:large subunit ribosomal protein L1
VANKRLKKMYSEIDLKKSYSVLDSIKILKENSKVKFDETVEISINLGVDPKQSDQMVRGVVGLPNGTGKSVVVAAFVREDKIEEVKSFGADIVGAEDLVAKIESEGVFFDKCVATPDMMPLISKIAKILGPRGLMPNPKLGTVTVNLKDAIKNIKAGQVEFKVEKAGIIHAGVGKISFDENKLEENIKVFLDALYKAKPAASKGVYFLNAYLSSTMGVGLKLDLSSLI